MRGLTSRFIANSWRQNRNMNTLFGRYSPNHEQLKCPPRRDPDFVDRRKTQHRAHTTDWKVPDRAWGRSGHSNLSPTGNIDWVTVAGHKDPRNHMYRFRWKTDMSSAHQAQWACLCSPSSIHEWSLGKTANVDRTLWLPGNNGSQPDPTGSGHLVPRPSAWRQCFTQCNRKTRSGLHRCSPCCQRLQTPIASRSHWGPV